MPALRTAPLVLALAAAGCATLPDTPASVALPLPDAPAARLEPLPEPPLPPQPTIVDPGHELVSRALGYLGVRYRFGGTSPETGFDCSGFVRWVFRDTASPQLPRTSFDMAHLDAPEVEPSELAAGDLVFFRIRGRRVSHVGIYVGDEQFVHAPSRGGTVRVDRLDDHYWKRRYAGAKRVLTRR